MATAKRNTYKYHMKIGNKIVHRGVTKDLDRRESEHRQNFGSNSHIMQVGNRSTREGALDWEREGGTNS